MYRYLAKLYPKKLKKAYINLFRYSNIRLNADRFIGFIIIFSFLLSLALAFYLGTLFKIPIIVYVIALFLLFQILIYLWLLLKADAKAKFVESILPDVLQLTASNLRAGLTTDKALLLSARPEFGPFQDELNQVGKEIAMSKDISVALMDMTKNIKSEKLKKSIALIVSGLKSGGELASLLEQTSGNLRREELVESRIRANVIMYVIFIFVAVCFGAPMLFGLSSFLVEILTQSLGSVQLPENVASTLPISFTQVSISLDFVIMFAITFLITSSILGSLILGLISKGKERDGLKYIPALMFLSIIIFFLVRFAIKNVLSGLFGF